MDGLSKPKQIADRCVNIGVSACAITDHGTISGCVQIHKELRSKKIKPILGCEIYVSKDKSEIKTKENSKLSHLILLAKNYQGWKTLIKIVSESNEECNFYHKPRLDIDKLTKLLDGNIIGFCGHLGSYISNIVSSSTNPIKEGVYSASHLQEIFGIDNFYLETQLMDQFITPEQVILTDKIREISKQTNIKTICTPDAHYCCKEDAVDQRILLCNNLKTTLVDINTNIMNEKNIPMECFFKSDNYHILSPEEMEDIHTEEEINNTIEIADKCEDYDIASKPLLPPFVCPDGYNPDEYLRQLCRNGWVEKVANKVHKDNTDTYVNRIKYELEVLQGADLSSYFLIVQDIVSYVRNNKWLPGPGRGSAAGCLVSYLIGITSIDPIKYNLMFDRFYNAGRNTKTRISMPDIDVDVPINKRENIIQYIKDKYGINKVSQMITFNTMKGRGALKEVLRVYGNISFEEMNNITKCIPDEAKIADQLQEMKDDYGESSIIRWALENSGDKLKQWCYLSDNDELMGPLAKRFEQAIRLEGTKSNQSKHAAGIVISNENLSTLCPMVYDTKNKQMIAGMEMQDLETLGIIKFDILGVAMLDKVMDISFKLESGG